MLDTDVADPSAATVVEEGLAAAIVGEGAGGVVTAVELGSGKQRNAGGDNVVDIDEDNSGGEVATCTEVVVAARRLEEKVESGT